MNLNIRDEIRLTFNVGGSAEQMIKMLNMYGSKSIIDAITTDPLTTTHTMSWACIVFNLKPDQFVCYTKK